MNGEREQEKSHSGMEDGHGGGLTARLRASLIKYPNEERLELARHLAQLQAHDEVPTRGLAARLRRSLGGQPMGATALCRQHHWVRAGSSGIVCAVCGLSSGT